MNKSDIFDSFVKIAQEKGLISEDAPEQAKKKLEKTHRADSLDISAIEALYGVKPDAPKGSEYTRNIMENAHPNAVVVSPSYDKLNGLVENNNERQDIILHILDKTPNGHLTQHKYAEKELLLSLVRLGNHLDNQNKEDLRILADTCLLQVSNKPLKKEAAVPMVLGVAAIIGALYLQQHMSFLNEGFEQNHQKLMKELNDLIQSSSSWGVGYDYTVDFKKMVQDFSDKLTKFYTLYKKVEPIISDLEKPRTAQELIELSKQPQTDSVLKAHQALKSAVDEMLPYINQIENNFKSESFKVRQVSDKGWISSLIDKTQVLHGGKGLVADDFDDVVRAISPYKQSISDIMNVLKQAESLKKKAQDDLQKASMESQKDFSAPGPKPTKSVEDDLGIGDLEKELGNLG
jgi:hypothetical protein